MLTVVSDVSLLFAGQKDGGTQIKLIIDYPDNVQALFKPMRSVATGCQPRPTARW
jgi:hypothetical protein